jgi:quercetin dioxygenase-like cupin family protein/DNA-binding Xre family transcriptional regulator
MKKEGAKHKVSARTNPGKRKMAKHHDLLTDLTGMERADEAKESLSNRIRRVRQERGLTIEDLSSRTAIDKAYLERMESGETIPALGQLVRLGRALDMKMGYFISPGVDQLMTVVRKNARRPISRFGETKSMEHGYFYECLAPEKADRFMEPFIVTLVPTATEEFSTHAGQEFLYVLEGEMKVQVGDRVEFLKPGDAVYYDSDQPHLVKCVGKIVTKILAVIYTGSN